MMALEGGSFGLQLGRAGDWTFCPFAHESENRPSNILGQQS